MTLSAILIGNDTLTLECARLWHERGHDLVAVVTRNDALRHWAEARDIRVHLPGRDLGARLTGNQADWILSIANLSLVPDDVLALARQGGVNFHDGPLPRHAGLNAPVWALLEGDTDHAITWHRMTTGVDEGNILLSQGFDLTADDTALSVNTKCFTAALESFPELMAMLEGGEVEGRAQSLDQRTLHARADRPADAAVLNFEGPAEAIVRTARALDHGTYWNPLSSPKFVIDGKVWLVGQAETTEGDGTPGTVLAVDNDKGNVTLATGDGAVLLSSLRDGWGEAYPELPQTGQEATPIGTDAGRALAEVARHEPFWRRALSEHPPARPAILAESDAPLHRASITLPGRTGDELLGMAALFLARLGGNEATQIAVARDSSGSAPASPILSDWFPVKVDPAQDIALASFAQSVAEQVQRRAARAGFACDLLARDAELREARPYVALRRDGVHAALDDMRLTLSVGTNGIEIFARSDDATFDLLTARLDAMADADAATALQEIPAMGTAERELVTTGWNRTGKPYDMLCLHEAFEAQADRTPDTIAIHFEAEAITYAALEARANVIAHALIEAGVARGDLVGLSTRRGIDMVAGALAILKTGAAYVPMDPAYPADRLALYAQDSGARIVLTQGATVLPEGIARLDLDGISHAAASPPARPRSGVGPADLAYLIYTSGSTGKPKGVMVEHRNVANFFAGMDERIPAEDGKRWLAVTSLNFDISVLELFYTLARGYTVVLSGDESRALAASGELPTSRGGMEFSLFYWGNDDGQGRDKYRLLLEGAQFADQHGFCAVWTPERHFHAFGGPYPNPSVTGAAVAAVTRNISVRAGSCVAPLHHTARIAEEWAVIDNLTNGRAALAIASGWQPDDFVLRPENTPPQNKPAMYDAIRDLRALWRGEAVEFDRADGSKHAVVTQPRPVSRELPIWVTTAGNPETWREAGEIGANVLTHLLGQSVEEVGQKIEIYHAALRAAGRDPADHSVTLMLHSYLAETREEAREIAREPMKDYLRSAAGLIKQYAWAFPAFKKPKGVDNPFQLDLGGLDEEEMDAILDFAFQRYFEDSGLFGTVEDALARVEEVKRIGVTEIACLIDYGIDVDTVLAGLRPLARVLAGANRTQDIPEDDFSIAAQILRHNVSHLQCTPSMARMLLMSDEARHALGQVDHLMIGGEALPAQLVRDLRDVTTARIENMYGPTETTIWSSTRSVGEAEGTVDIGTPVANTRLYVLDAGMQPCPVGVAGELWIGGDGVTRGYHGRDTLTADRFRPNPYHKGGRIYGTGDLVRRRADGVLDFLGRADTQVKLRGYRIELGEIETATEALDGVNEAVVLAREDRPGDIRLVAYVRGPSAEPARIKAALAQALPAHMVPAHVVVMAQFPLTPNRKIDRKALPAPGTEADTLAPVAAQETRTHKRATSATGAQRPAGDGDGLSVQQAETAITAIWERILGVSGIGVRSNFFELGGHSLLAVQAHRDIKSELGVALAITDIFRFPTLGALAARIGTDTPTGTAEADTGEAASAAVNARASARRDAMSRRRAMRAARRAS